MGDVLIKILDELTLLTKDKDLFYLEMPLDKGGLWVSEAQIDSRFNDTGRQEFDIYYRGKNKDSSIKNIKYLKDTIDSFSGSQGVCKLSDGTAFSIKMILTWDYLEKDSEGYFVWASRLSLIAENQNSIISA